MTGERAAQRRRTRRAIVEATSRLLAAGATPSVGEIAEAAEVSRRTVYLHFPTLDQLVADALAGALSSGVDAALDTAHPTDARVRVVALIAAMSAAMDSTLGLGRKLIRHTVEAPPADGRGHRRVGWIERAVSPLRTQLEPAAFERLVSALAVVIGWEAFIVLADVRGLDLAESTEVVTASALALLDGLGPPPGGEG